MRRAPAALLALFVSAGASAAPLALARAATTADAFVKTVTVSRTVVQAGKDVGVDTRTITLHVDRTTGLRDRDGMQVSWSGAHPTGGVYGDIHSASASSEEYPMVLLECRGVDSTSVPEAQRLSPQTCFTQSPAERYVQDGNTAWAEWRMDRYANAGDLPQTVGLPTQLPKDCPAIYGAIHNVPFATASGTVLPIGPGGCLGTAPEMSALATTGLPSNTAYAVTTVEGKGDVRFDVRTAESNASLGCSQTVPCALVAVPVMGISCDLDFGNLPSSDRPTDADEIDLDRAQCSAKGVYQPGQPSGSQTVARSVSGRLWWAASNWRGRITVPLSFAPSSKACDVVGGSAPTYLYGSELMIQAMTSWAPHFCLDPKLFPVKHVQTGEPQARHLLRNGTIEAALGSDQPDGGWPMPVVSAPVAMTGFSIAFAIDDKDQLPVNRLNLTPRLLAKLLTESYPAVRDIRDRYGALSHNPLDLRDDPEFQALNPGQVQAPGGIAAATLFALSSDSDVMRALTSYIDADPDARAWLDGTPDPWGMVVNPNYKGIALPTDAWPLRDEFLMDPEPNDCLRQNPAPFLNLIAAPTQRIPSISLALQYAISPSPSTATCVVTDTGVGNKLVATGPEVGGKRFIIGVTSIADAERFGLPQASLLTHTDPTSASRFTDATGRTFVPPTDTSLAAAASLLTADNESNSWHVDSKSLRSAATGAGAYPGAMLINATIPTTGLSAQDAAHYATFLSWATTSGQVRGAEQGQLPAGYLPLTSVNGLALQQGYTARAAAAVAAQKGAKVPLVATRTAPSLLPTPASGPDPSVAGSIPAPSGGTARGPASGTVPGPVPGTAPGRTSAPSAVPHALPAAAIGRTPAAALGRLADALPLLALVGALAAAVTLPGLFVRGKGAV